MSLSDSGLNHTAVKAADEEKKELAAGAQEQDEGNHSSNHSHAQSNATCEVVPRKKGFRSFVTSPGYKQAELEALKEIGFECCPLAEEDISIYPDEEERKLYQQWMVKVHMVAPEKRKAQEVKNEFTAAALIQMLSALFACACGKVKFGQKLKATQHILCKHGPGSANGGTSTMVSSKRRRSAEYDYDDEYDSYSSSNHHTASNSAFPYKFGPSASTATPSSSIKVKPDPDSVAVKCEYEVDAANAKCTQCGKTDTSLFNCSACMRVIYCSLDCQKAHWKKHKHECKTFQAQAAEAKNKPTASAPATPAATSITKSENGAIPAENNQNTSGGNELPAAQFVDSTSTNTGNVIDCTTDKVIIDNPAPLGSVVPITPNMLPPERQLREQLNRISTEMHVWKEEALRLRRERMRKEAQKKKAALLAQAAAANDAAAATLQRQQSTQEDAAALAEDSALLREWQRLFGTKTPAAALHFWQRKAGEGNTPDESMTDGPIHGGATSSPTAAGGAASSTSVSSPIASSAAQSDSVMLSPSHYSSMPALESSSAAYETTCNMEVSGAADDDADGDADADAEPALKKQKVTEVTV